MRVAHAFRLDNNVITLIIKAKAMSYMFLQSQTSLDG